MLCNTNGVSADCLPGTIAFAEQDRPNQEVPHSVYIYLLQWEFCLSEDYYGLQGLAPRNQRWSHLVILLDQSKIVPNSGPQPQLELYQFTSAELSSGYLLERCPCKY